MCVLPALREETDDGWLQRKQRGSEGETQAVGRQTLMEGVGGRGGI